MPNGLCCTTARVCAPSSISCAPSWTASVPRRPICAATSSVGLSPSSSPSSKPPIPIEADLFERATASAPPSPYRRHDVFGAGADPGGPARGQHLERDIKAYAFHAVPRPLAEQRALPAAEAVEGHRHRDRHVDADHADLDAVGEFARGIAVAREDRRAVALLGGAE